MSEYRIVETGIFRSSKDLVRLQIVNWRGLNGSWASYHDARRSISSWLVGLACYTVVEVDMPAAPQQPGWPDWEHIGRHPEIGRLFWNWFHHTQPKGSELSFGDAPDFRGLIRWPDGAVARLWGDVGRVSAQAFALSLMDMGPHDVWLSVCDERRHVAIEPVCDLRALADAQRWGSLPHRDEPLPVAAVPSDPPSSIDFASIDDDAYVSHADIANYLRVDRWTIYQMCRSGELPARKLNGSFHLRWGDFDAWCRRCAGVASPRAR